MNQPLGQAVGNALEVREAVATLHGGGPADFREHCLVVGSHMLVAGRKAKDLNQARMMLEKAIAEGQAWEKFRQLVIAQGGDVSYVDDVEKLPRAAVIQTLAADRSGWLAQVHARIAGEVSVTLGAGREKKGDPIDHSVGIMVHRKVGEYVEQGEPLFTIHARSVEEATAAAKRLSGALQWSKTPVAPLPLFYGVME
jgi:pyrimidine-nucleoside phosphorylase